MPGAGPDPARSPWAGVPAVGGDTEEVWEDRYGAASERWVDPAVVWPSEAATPMVPGAPVSVGAVPGTFPGSSGVTAGGGVPAATTSWGAQSPAVLPAPSATPRPVAGVSAGGVPLVGVPGPVAVWATVGRSVLPVLAGLVPAGLMFLGLLQLSRMASGDDPWVLLDPPWWMQLIRLAGAALAAFTGMYVVSVVSRVAAGRGPVMVPSAVVGAVGAATLLGSVLVPLWVVNWLVAQVLSASVDLVGARTAMRGAVWVSLALWLVTGLAGSAVCVGVVRASVSGAGERR